MKVTYRYRLYPTVAQARLLGVHLGEACRLYNGALAERRGAWRASRTRISLYAQGAQLKDIRASGDLDLPNHTCAQEVLRRVDRAFQAFFRRVKGYEWLTRAYVHPRDWDSCPACHASLTFNRAIPVEAPRAE